MAKEIQVIVKEKREALGLSVRAIADRVGVSRSLISQWENKTKPIPLNRFPALAKALEMSVEDLTGASRYVRSHADAHEWRDQVMRDHSLDPHVQLVLAWLPDLRDDKAAIWTFSGSIRAAASLVRSLTLAQVEACWPGVVSAAYIEHVGDSAWTLRMRFPTDPRTQA